MDLSTIRWIFKTFKFCKSTIHQTFTTTTHNQIITQSHPNKSPIKSPKYPPKCFRFVSTWVSRKTDSWNILMGKFWNSYFLLHIGGHGPVDFLSSGLGASMPTFVGLSGKNVKNGQKWWIWTTFENKSCRSSWVHPINIFRPCVCPFFVRLWEK